MKLIMPSVEKDKRAYEIQVFRFQKFLLNRKLGPIAVREKGRSPFKVLYKRHGYTTKGGCISSGYPYDGRLEKRYCIAQED